MVRVQRTRPVSGTQMRAYLAKSIEFLDAATDELDANRPIAATSLAIHAAISAGDAVCGTALGLHSAGQDHRQTLQLLSTCGTPGEKLARHLGRLLPLKASAEYEPQGIAFPVARKSVSRAKSCVTIATQVANEGR